MRSKYFTAKPYFTRRRRISLKKAPRRSLSLGDASEMSRSDRGYGREVRGWIHHAYSRKYSRFARLDATLRLGFKTPYFRNVTLKKDTQSFFEVSLPTSRISIKKERINVNREVVDRRSTRGANEKARGDCLGLFVELVGQNCNSVKSRILCLRFINTEIIPLNTVLVNRFLKSFCKIIETMSYYFLYLMYKYRLKRGKPILSLSFLCCFYFS